MIDIEKYRTNNLNIASYLYASGLKLESTLKNNSIFTFIFTPKEKAEELIQKYFDGTAHVNPRDLFARLKDLKDLIFNKYE